MPAFGITAIGQLKKKNGGDNAAGKYLVTLDGAEVFRGSSKEVSIKYGIHQKAVSHYSLKHGKLRNKYLVERID